MSGLRTTVTNGRMRAVVKATGGALALVLIAASCSYAQLRINDARAAAGRSRLPNSTVLSAAAREHTQAMCNARTVGAAPAGSYDQETATSVHELVGAAPVDMANPNADNRDLAAMDQVLNVWKNQSATIGSSKWADIGSSEIKCPDGKWYMTTVLREASKMPASGLYSTPQYDASAIQRINNLQYGSAVNVQGVNQALQLDLYLPPGGTPAARPTVLLFHGGGFVGGNRTYMDPEAVSFAQRGYVAATVTYRLSTSALMSQPNGLFNAAGNGIDDGMEAVRWLKANAATYRIATDKIGTMGASAGGVIGLGMALVDDPTPGGPLAAQSPKIAASVSTGAHLTPAIGTPLLTFEPTDAAIMMLHYENDSTTEATDEYAFETCAAARAGGSTCDFVVNPGSGHGAWVQPGGSYWNPKIGPFLYTQLRLGS